MCKIKRIRLCLSFFLIFFSIVIGLSGDEIKIVGSKEYQERKKNIIVGGTASGPKKKSFYAAVSINGEKNTKYKLWKINMRNGEITKSDTFLKLPNDKLEQNRSYITSLIYMKGSQSFYVFIKEASNGSWPSLLKINTNGKVTKRWNLMKNKFFKTLGVIKINKDRFLISGCNRNECYLILKDHSGKTEWKKNLSNTFEGDIIVNEGISINHKVFLAGWRTNSPSEGIIFEIEIESGKVLKRKTFPSRLFTIRFDKVNSKRFVVSYAGKSDERTQKSHGFLHLITTSLETIWKKRFTKMKRMVQDDSPVYFKQSKFLISFTRSFKNYDARIFRLLNRKGDILHSKKQKMGFSPNGKATFFEHDNSIVLLSPSIYPKTTKKKRELLKKNHGFNETITFFRLKLNLSE